MKKNVQIQCQQGEIEFRSKRMELKIAEEIWWEICGENEKRLPVQLIFHKSTSACRWHLIFMQLR